MRLTVEVKAYGQRAQRVEVADIGEARRVQEEAIEAGGYGASAWQGGAIHRDGKAVARLSYNGRLWALRGNVELNDDFTIREEAKS